MKDSTLKNKTIAMRTGRIQMRRDREYWTQDDLARLEEMYFAGYGINEIALALERSETAIYQQLERKKLVYRSGRTSRKRLRMIKDGECLCETCKCDQTLCPRFGHCEIIREDA